MNKGAPADDTGFGDGLLEGLGEALAWRRRQLELETKNINVKFRPPPSTPVIWSKSPNGEAGNVDE